MDNSVDTRVNRLEIAVLGQPLVRRDGQAIAFRTRKAQALLLYLAVEGGTHRRESLAELLWGESDAAHARQMLRTSLAHLKQAFAPAPNVLLSDEDELGLDPNVPLDLDLAVLERAAAVISGNGLAPETLLNLYRGAFLQNFYLQDAPAFDDWVRARRERVHEQYRVLLRDLAAAQETRGELRAALVTAERWRVHEPLDEAAAQQVIRLHLALDDRTSAWRTFEQVRETLAREMAAAPSLETLTLAEQVRQAPVSVHAADVARERATNAPSPQQFIAAVPLIGRASEFARAMQAWQGAVNGEPQVIVLTGEAGIGKTRLATDLARYIRAQGGQALSGRAFETGGTLPFQPLVEQIRPRLEHENAPDDLLSDVWLAELTRLLPELVERYPDLVPPRDQTPARLFEAYARLIAALAAQTPTVLFLDDAQWADAASLEALEYALGRLREQNARVALLLTLRSEALGEFSSWLVRAGRNAVVTVLDLQPLSVHDTRQLVDTLAAPQAPTTSTETVTSSGAFGDWLYQETRGQPFFIIETLKALLEQGSVSAVRGQDGAWAMQLDKLPDTSPGISPDVQHVVRSRLNLLPRPAVELLTAAAVMGSETELDALLAISGQAENDALDVLDVLLQSGLLRSSRAGQVAVGHDKIREAVYAMVSPPRRRVLHRRAYEWLTTQDGAPTARAEHAMEAGLEGHAYHAWIAAGDRALRVNAVRDAIRAYEQARELAGGVLINPSLYLQLGRAYELANEVPAAKRTFGELLELARAAANLGAEAAALNRLATLAAQQFDLSEAIPLSGQADALAQASQDQKLRAETQWSLAQLQFYRAEFRVGAAHGEQALALATEVQDAELVARSNNILAYHLSVLGEMRRAAAAARAAQQQFHTLGNVALEMDSAIHLANIQLRAGDTRVSLATALTVRELAARQVNPWGEANAEIQLALTALDLGDLGGALEYAQTALDRTEREHLNFVGLFAQVALGVVLRAWGRTAESQAHLERAVAQSVHIDAVNAGIHAELAAAYAAAGDWARAGVHAAQSATRRAFHPMMFLRTGLYLETAALVRAGERELAVAQLERFASLGQESERYAFTYERARAELEPNPIASTAFARALALAEKLGLKIELWNMYALRGDTARAAQTLDALAATIADDALRTRFMDSAVSC